MKFIVGLLLVLLLALQYQLWISKDGLGELRQLSRSIKQQRHENATLTERNQVLKAEVQDLKSGLDALEERARSGLGMIKQGETFFQVVEEP